MPARMSLAAGELASAAAAAAWPLALDFAGGDPAPASAIWLRLVSGSAGSQRSTASLKVHGTSDDSND